jgi:hypothetical protein
MLRTKCKSAGARVGRGAYGVGGGGEHGQGCRLRWGGRAQRRRADPGGWWTGRADLGCTGSIDDEEAGGDDEMESLLVGWI